MLWCRLLQRDRNYWVLVGLGRRFSILFEFLYGVAFQERFALFLAGIFSKCFVFLVEYVFKSDAFVVCTAIATIPIARLSVVLVVALAFTLVFRQAASSGGGRWRHVIRVQTIVLLGGELKK